jgi:hypothetical protein
MPTCRKTPKGGSMTVMMILISSIFSPCADNGFNIFKSFVTVMPWYHTPYPGGGKEKTQNNVGQAAFHVLC